MTPYYRGDVYDVDFPLAGLHPAVIVTREEAIPILSSITVALVSSTIRGHAAEVVLDHTRLQLDHESAANCDDLYTVSKERFGNYRGHLGPAETVQLNQALALALGID